QIISNELSTPKILFCPAEDDRQRIAANTFSIGAANPHSVPFTNDNNLSYFAALDAYAAFPERLLTGDRNLVVGGRPAPHGLLQVWTNTIVTWAGSMHKHNGNIALADGSVQQVNSPRLRIVFVQSGMSTNRLAIP